jgi:hypothetical protein
MNTINLNLSVITCEKLKSIVGQGNRSPYQVWITPGNYIGQSGQVINASEFNASNDSETLPVGHVQVSWLTSVLSALTLKRS